MLSLPAAIGDRGDQPPGRNDPCYCGSGKKYKRCHLDPDLEAARAFQYALPNLVERQRHAAEMEAKLRSEYSTYINFVLPVQWDGGKAWAIGSRLYLRRPAKETFHEFLISLLRETFSEEWRQAQVSLPDDQQHFLLKCSSEWAKFKEERSEEADADGLFSATPNGWVQYFISLAWDIGTLIHATQLPDALVARLRDYDQFQGARYEVAVAAVFARLDFEIEFLDDNAMRDKPHPEFVATHRPSGFRVAVEAKSRHRPGVLNDRRVPDDVAIAVGGDVQRLLGKAIPKAMERTPFLIFLEVNAPSVVKSDRENRWQVEVKEWMNKLYPDGSTEPQPVGGVAFTNFAPHYDGDELAQGVEWVYFRLPGTEFPIDDAIAAMLRQALHQYHRVPDLTEDGQIY
jgi:SEC-C motif